jgi:uncharacterized protein (DUF58 family)
LKPRKGLPQAYQLIYSLAKLQPKSLKTNLAKAISFALNSIKKRSVIIMISDFIDEGYEHNLKSLARKHDLVVIRICDKRETNLPKLGIIPVQDKETKKTIWINTSFGDFRSHLTANYITREKTLSDFSRKHQINFVSVDTGEDYVPKLLKLFKIRNKSVKRV